MPECFICKSRIQKFHDKLEVATGKQCCYKCAPYIREANKAESKVYPIKKKRLMEHINNPAIGASNEAKKEIYCLLNRLDSKHAISSDYRAMCPVCEEFYDSSSRGCTICGYERRDVFLNSEERIELLKQNSQLIESAPLYEYVVETVQDTELLGQINKKAVQNRIMEYALSGWRLHSAFTNELGKNALEIMGVGINATLEETVLIFERRLRG